MHQRFYPAVLERGPEAYWIYFPDFDGCTSGGATATEAALNAADALATFTADWRGPLPQPSPLDTPLDAEVEPVALVLIPLTIGEAQLPEAA